MVPFWVELPSSPHMYFRLIGAFKPPQQWVCVNGVCSLWWTGDQSRMYSSSSSLMAAGIGSSTARILNRNMCQLTEKDEWKTNSGTASICFKTTVCFEGQKKFNITLTWCFRIFFCYVINICENFQLWWRLSGDFFPFHYSLSRKKDNSISGLIYQAKMLNLSIIFSFLNIKFFWVFEKLSFTFYNCLMIVDENNGQITWFKKKCPVHIRN